ncbi:hypothetical protein [uncultured Gimesia sp.]|uniref:hypothetical protein n=1 Tax=uncultured Gimesia sp. TaxID=1678688 RepID=UPI0030D891B2|tara:strand:- start:7934 stop:8215 length:282 start_codon:yes stop_codon:yes gene_type:complete
MGKKASSTIKAGSNVRVKEGICVPEFSEICCEGWTGMVVEVRGKKVAERSYILEWDEETEQKMPEIYKSQCEEQGLFFKMACLPGDALLLSDS